MQQKYIHKYIHKLKPDSWAKMSMSTQNPNFTMENKVNESIDLFYSLELQATHGLF